jgi:hypothetical protein
MTADYSSLLSLFPVLSELPVVRETVTVYWRVFTYCDKNETVTKTNFTQKTAGN